MAEIDLRNISYGKTIKNEDSGPIIYLTDCSESYTSLKLPRVMITVSSKLDIEDIRNLLTQPMESDSKGRSFVNDAAIEVVRVEGADRLFVKGAGLDIIGSFLKNKGYFSSPEIGSRARH